MPNADLKRSISLSILADPLLALVDITHESFAEPVRMAANQEDVTSGGNVYTATGMSIGLASQEANSLPEVSLTVSNIETSLSKAFRGLQIQNVDPPLVEVRFVLASSPDLLEEGPLKWQVKAVSITAEVMTLTLSSRDLISRGFPRLRFLPQTAPLLFPRG